MKATQRRAATRRTRKAIAAAAIIAIATGVNAQAQEAPAIDADDIGGVVRGPNGPEAGVWVIAETRDLPVRFIRIVATDDQGRFVVPDLPKANYDVWVRGYGLVDSDKVKSEPGKTLTLSAKVAPTEAAAANYYPAIYWYSMMKIPGADQFGGKSDIPEKITQADWLNLMKNNGCVGCHQLGQLSTRTIPKSLGEFANHEEAWLRRIQSGQAGELMVNIIAGQLNTVPIKYFGEWTQRVANGELPKHKPARPQGEERNIVVTLRDWMDEKHYLHDLIASDRRKPTVNAYGPLYGSPEYSSDMMPILDPDQEHGDDVPDAGGAGHARSARPGTCGEHRRPPALALLGRREICGHRAPTITTPCSTRRAACGWRPPATARTIRTSARRAPIIPPPRSSRSTAPTGA